MPADVQTQRVAGRSFAAVVLALTVLAAAIYAQSAGFAFLDYDDPLVVTENEVVQEGLSAKSLPFAFRDTRMNLYHPLTWLSHMMDVSIFGDWAGGHHLVNALLHLANGLLVFLLVARLGGRALPSFLLAALFVVHPLHVESVAWISERKDVLSTFFYLLTVLLYIRWTATKSWKPYAAAFAACLLGFLAKPSLMTLPLALLLLDCWPLRRLDLGKLKEVPPRALKLALEKFPFFALAAIFMAVAWRVEASGAHAGVAEMTSFGERLAFSGLAYGSWLLRSFWPAGLSTFYPHPTTFPAGAVAASWATVITLSILAIAFRQRAPWFFTGWFWFVLLLFPASGIITISDNFAPDRYTYLAHANLGKILAKRGDTGAAIGHFERAIAAKPKDPAMRRALLPLLQDASRPPTEVIPHLEALVRLDPRDAKVRYDLATLLQREGRREESLPHYLAAAKLTPPENYLVRGDLGATLVQLERYGEALPHLEAAARQPDNPFAPRASYLLGFAHHKLGHDEIAIPHLEAAIRADPSLIQAQRALEGLRKGQETP